MTKTYQIHARCVRSFTSWIEIEASTADEALAKARLEDSELVAAAQDCADWPWDEFTAYGEDGTELLRVFGAEARVRNAAPVMRETLSYVAQMLADVKPDYLRQIGLDVALELVEKALAIADNANVQPPASAIEDVRS